MRVPPISILPLVLALIALVFAGYTSGLSAVLTVGLAVATLMIGLAVIFQHVMSPEAKQVPIENFSLWADVGEPGAELKRLSLDDISAAVRIAAADMGSLASNAELLGARISILADRPEFEELSREKLHKQVEGIAHDIKVVVNKLRSANGFPSKITASLEQYAAQSDRVANRLFEFEHGKSEVIHIYVEPLRRAAEKLSRDIRLASANMSNFVRGAEGTNP